MDQTDKSRILNSRCRAGINNPKCSRKNLRSLSSSIIEQIHSLGYDHQLDETMRICESCRVVIKNNRSTPTKNKSFGWWSKQVPDDLQPETSFNEPNQAPEDPQPSTSGQNLNSNRSAPSRKRRSDGDEPNQVPEDPQPSTSGPNDDVILGKKIDFNFKQEY